MYINENPGEIAEKAARVHDYAEKQKKDSGVDVKPVHDTEPSKLGE